MKITNLSRGPRIFNVGKKGEATLDQVTIAPGETADVDLQDEKHPVVQAMLASGEIAFGKEGEKAATDEEREPARPANLDGMTDDDLKRYIKEYSGSGVQGNPNRETLLKRAREIAAQRS